MISASKCKFVEKASYYQYNTENSLNRIEITLSQRISPNHHSFQLEKQICWKFGDLLPEQQNCQHRLKWFQIQTIAEKFSLTLCILQVPSLRRKLPNVGKVHPVCPVKRISSQDQIFRFKLPFEQQSFISGVDQYVQILRLAVQLQQMCNCDSLN
ncbi:Hypothetical_protein [Hexamita inflata]|uniref:Hypothetical_protein n=1 Tax=Hexamita inflata TaxID=28002 RepID=A0AA86PCL2_9EUKA|nr:Hypothetical protein HINF_LOCUS22961 [Hexamita inflata]